MRNLLQYEFDIILLILKIIIAVLWLIDFFLEYIFVENIHINKKNLSNWHISISFWFSFFIGLLIIYMFNPWTNIPITRQTKLSLFTFGILYLLNLNWNMYSSDQRYILKVAS